MAISAAPTTEDDTYYHQNDRYNGKAASENGFWADFQTALTAAETVNNDASVSQKQVDAATTVLTTAIDDLIPTAQINATKLYEALKNAQDLVWLSGTAIPRPDGWTGEDSLVVTKSTTSVITWSPYQAALTDGRSLLDSLFDEDGTPTAANTSTDTAFAQQVDDQAAAIDDAVAALDSRTDEAGVSRSETALAGIDLYANTLYNTDYLTEPGYTADSWKTFIETRDAALDVLKDGKSFTGMGDRVVKAQQQAFAELRAACYGLVNAGSTITVHFSAVDNYAVRKEKTSMAVNTCDLVLNAGATVADALDAADVSPDTDYKLYSAVKYYLNGISYVNTPDATVQATAADVKLRDGDTLVVALEAPPTYTNASGTEAIDRDVLPSYETITVPSSAVPAGEPFTVSVTADGSAPASHTGVASPLSGATVYSSTACATEEEARTAQVTQSTGALTDEDGRAGVKLYSEGWYALNVFDLSDNGGVCNGRTVFVHVTAAADIDAVKDELKDMLTTLVKKYSGNFFTSADWQSIQAAEATALAGIDNAASTGEAYRAQQTAQKTITAIQEAAVEANTDNLYYFHNLLNMLPDDTAKIDKSAEGKIENLISRYGSMTEYQLQQLTPLEIQKYKEIETVYTDGLPDARDYALFVETVIEDGSDEDDRALTDMVQWLETHTASDDIYEEESQSLAALDSFYTVTYNFSKRGYVLTPVIAAPAYTSNVSVCVNPDYAAYFHVRNQDLPTGVNWSISDENVTISSNSTIATLKGRMTYTVNGTAYEIKDINVDGVDESSLASITLPFLDTSTYKDKTQAAIKLSIPESFLQFTMPYSDVKVTVTWGPAAGTAGEISAAQDAARSAIESAYAGYRKSDYSVENWAVLTRAKTDGLAAVEAAVSVKAVKTERQAALAAMAAVKKNSTDAGTEVDLPDYGKTVGQVYITVENNTFSDGAFTGKIIDGQYDLCAEDTMMTAVLKALKAKGYSWTGTGGTGYDITYLASIYIDANSNGKYDGGEKELGEFDGEPGSGWMGTLNDWFVNAGFNEFSAENTGNDALENGDVIDVVYTQDLGADVGGTWGNSDTGLSALKIDGGTLSPDFDSDTLNYCLIISGNKANVFVTPTATNKNYLVKTFLNTYNSDGALYKRTETIPVKSGDVIYVGCGEYSWPSMNNQSEDAISYTGTQYTVKVYSSGKDGVQAQIDALPDAGKITRSNYKTYQNMVVQVRKAYDALSDKTGVTVAKLTAAESKIKFFSEIDAVKSKLSALLDSDRATDAQIKAARRAIEAADTAYKALSQEQQDYITVGDVTNYNKLVARLSKLTTTSAGSISGSTTVPTEKETDTTVLKPDVTVSGATVFARIGKSDLAEAVAAANTAGSGSITISAETDRIVTASEVTLNAKGVQGVGTDSKADIIISTPDGALTLPNNTLSMLASSGSDIVVAMMEKNVSDLKLTDVDTRNALAAEITITVGGKAVTTFEGESLNIDLPVNGNYTKGADYNVMVISADGSREIVTGKCIEKDGGLYVKIATTHLSIFVVTNGKVMNFADIKAGAWYYDAVKYAYDNGLFEGTSDTTFSPDVPMTRAMLATVLYRMGGTPAVTGTSIFTDVADGEFYTDAVIWATENNIVKGTSNTTFDPNASVTREQMAVILYRYAAYRKYDTAKTADISTFTDASSVSGYAIGAMQWANAEGLISGTTAAALVPNGTATRAQAATILMRLAESAEK